jgi:hypothetical protein
MNNALLVLPEHWFYYQFNDKEPYDHYASNPGKAFKVFNYICKEKKYTPYIYIPNGKDYSKFKSNKFKILKNTDIKRFNFEFIYLHKIGALSYFNKYFTKGTSKVFLFVEKYYKNIDIGDVDLVGCCSLSDKEKYIKNTIYSQNICNGKYVKIRNYIPEKKIIYIGRASLEIIKKINYLSVRFPNFYFHLYITKIINQATYFKVVGESVVFTDVSKDIKKFFPQSNCIIKPPLKNNNMYDVWSKEKYMAGFVPSIFDFDVEKEQINSSSKFYDYIGAGIPVLIEDLVPESKLVEKYSNIGAIYRNNEQNLYEIFNKIYLEKFNNLDIFKYAAENHSEKSRGNIIISNMKL